MEIVLGVASLVVLVLFISINTFPLRVVNANDEGDALDAFKEKLTDPNNVLQSWDPTLITPCTCFHISCNTGSQVIRVDLGGSELSGPLVPQLGKLKNLQYLDLTNNSDLQGPCTKNPCHHPLI